MSILRSLKSDLLDRRLLPILVLLGVAVVGAVAYTVLAGGSGSNPVAATPSPPPVAKGPTLAVTQAPANPNAAVAETTVGTRYQHKHGSHNPFIPLPSPSSAATGVSVASTNRSVATSGRGASSVTSGGGESSQSSAPTGKSEGKSSPSAPSGGGASPSEPSASAPKPKPVHKFVAELGLQFGPVSAPGAPSQLIQYTGVKRKQALPSSKAPLIVFAGLGAGRKSAIFTLSREAILQGAATCRPSTAQCEAIELQAGQSEQLSYLEPTGVTLTYELVLQSINWHETTVTATAARRQHRRR